MDNATTDRAREWVSENCPDLTDAEYEAKVQAVAQELAEIDAAADAADEAVSP